MGLAYRVTQFFQTLIAKPDPKDLELVDDQLEKPLAELFYLMEPPDQAHGIRVLRRLIARGERHPDLLAAALLHDVGKSRANPRIWDRVAVVLVEWLSPRAVKRWGGSEARGWRRPFVIAANHPGWGAEMISEAGGTQTLITLVGRHHDAPSGPETEIGRLLDQLIEVDNEN
jgi:hypothetical protein